MFCKFCGKQIPTRSKYCCFCGKKLMSIETRQIVANEGSRKKCVECGKVLPKDHDNKRCDRCRCEKLDRTISIGKKFLLGAAVVALAGLSSSDEDDGCSTTKGICVYCDSSMEYDEVWICSCCGHSVSREDADLGLFY